MRKIIFLDFDGVLNIIKVCYNFKGNNGRTNTEHFLTRKQFDNLNESLMQRVRILWLSLRGSTLVWKRCGNYRGLETYLEE